MMTGQQKLRGMLRKSILMQTKDPLTRGLLLISEQAWLMYACRHNSSLACSLACSQMNHKLCIDIVSRLLVLAFHATEQ